MSGSKFQLFSQGPGPAGKPGPAASSSKTSSSGAQPAGKSSSASKSTGNTVKGSAKAVAQSVKAKAENALAKAKAAAKAAKKASKAKAQAEAKAAARAMATAASKVEKENSVLAKARAAAVKAAAAKASTLKSDKSNQNQSPKDSLNYNKSTKTPPKFNANLIEVGTPVNNAGTSDSAFGELGALFASLGGPSSPPAAVYDGGVNAAAKSKSKSGPGPGVDCNAPVTVNAGPVSSKLVELPDDSNEEEKGSANEEDKGSSSSSASLYDAFGCANLVKSQLRGLPSARSAGSSTVSLIGGPSVLDSLFMGRISTPGVSPTDTIGGGGRHLLLQITRSCQWALIVIRGQIM